MIFIGGIQSFIAQSGTISGREKFEIMFHLMNMS